MPVLRNASPAVHYRVEPTQPHAHLFSVTLTVAKPAAQQQLSLPVWIPGSYLVREFAKNLQNLRAQQDGKDVPLAQLDKCRWEAQCRKTQPLVLTYEVCAYDTSVRTAFLDATRGFFNGTSVCLRVHGQEDARHDLEVVSTPAVARWSVATGLTAEKTTRAGFGTYTAEHYDELVDCPVEMGPFWSIRFTACGVPHRLVVSGAAPSFDGNRLVADIRRICEEGIRFWHGSGKPPYQNYLFLLNVVDDGYGGLEHRNSTALICGRRDLPRIGQARAPEGYNTLLGLVSHEHFHTWNVKRLRPAEFARYDYTQENHTRLLWFFEGFTSYYDDLLLRRAGMIDNATYLRLLTKTINQVLQTPGRRVQSVAQASFDAWVKYYRQDENTPNSTVSYYTKGSLVALCLDLALRREGQTTLDDVMRGLWERCAAGPMSEADLLATVQALAGRSFADEIAQWAHGTDDLPLAELLAANGVTLQDEPAQLAQRLGVRVAEGSGLQIKVVLRGGLAEQAGFAAGDEWVGVEVQGEAWRVQRLDDVPLYAGVEPHVTALVARDRKLLKLALELPNPGRTGAGHEIDTVGLSVADAALANRWLDGTTAQPER
ncbi:Predicted metalloprotease, contains C-terminal PDZ domain [Paracidovorax valerianellae]|uniref:Predicted metalloprotease, contains C-terminal PDZ domain n=1 Tax=Paracidovorax valerianellae TaxID=187868 RepID=A0A1G6PWH2_9BURK|nr:M61 family metallopeptidase [Paracidovorax valerianellae]SDC84542.1 Predicted metalloprotease, contains C-terminal PDZ domain [Paracidovorax valerianellae]